MSFKTNASSIMPTPGIASGIKSTGDKRYIKPTATIVMANQEALYFPEQMSLMKPYKSKNISLIEEYFDPDNLL